MTTQRTRWLQWQSSDKTLFCTGRGNPGLALDTCWCPFITRPPISEDLLVYAGELTQASSYITSCVSVVMCIIYTRYPNMLTRFCCTPSSITVVRELEQLWWAPGAQAGSTHHNYISQIQTISRCWYADHIYPHLDMEPSQYNLKNILQMFSKDNCSYIQTVILCKQSFTALKFSHLDEPFPAGLLLQTCIFGRT